MKLLERDFAVNQTGTAKLLAEEADDVWLLYNLILPGDVVSADTTRKVHRESSSKKSTATRVKLTLDLKVTCRDFHKDSSTIRLHGRNLQPSQHVAAGSFHTLTLEPHKPFHLRKKHWQNDAVETLSETVENSNSNSNPDSNSSPDLAVVLFHPHHAEIHLIAKGLATHCTKIEPSPNSRNSMFFRQVFAAFVKRVDFKVVTRVVITCEEFRRFMTSEAKKTRIRWIEENQSRIMVVSGGGDSLEKVLSDRAVTELVNDRKVAAFREVWEMVCKDSERACYGIAEVERALEMRAIETVLVTDDLYRNEDVERRKKYMDLVKSVKDSGGKALVYSSNHVSAPQLAQLTGLAAILRFPLPQLH